MIPLYVYLRPHAERRDFAVIADLAFPYSTFEGTMCQFTTT